MHKAEIRKDYLWDTYVIVTPKRKDRPRDVREKTVVERDAANCPFCEHNIDKKDILDRIDNSKTKNWNLLSLKNKYPAVTRKNKKAYGAQEVIIETPRHGKDLADLNRKQVERLLHMYKKRTEELAREKNIQYVLCFKNEGSKAGASIAHAHSQVFASRVIPPELREESKKIQDHYIQHGTCPYCDIASEEIKSKRGIYEDENISCFTPYASQYHYEVWILTKRHTNSIVNLYNKEITSLADCLKKLLDKMQQLNLSFNLSLHHIMSDEYRHFYIKVRPRDNTWGGVELGSGMVINSIPPEYAAKFYRK